MIKYKGINFIVELDREDDEDYSIFLEDSSIDLAGLLKVEVEDDIVAEARRDASEVYEED